MIIPYKSIALSLFFMSLSVSAQDCARIISAISSGKTIAQIEVPATVKLEVSGEKQIVNTEKTVMVFEGGSKLSVTFPSGEIMKMQSDKIEIKSCQPYKTSPHKHDRP